MGRRRALPLRLPARVGPRVMRAVNTVAWTEILGVGRKELPWALKGKARQFLDL